MSGTKIHDLSLRFWEKVNIKTKESCWEWNASKFSNGYGKFRLGKSMVGAHRVAWMLTFSDPKHLLVLHRCDNRACVNPSHLFLGNHSDNTQDMLSKGRGNYFHKIDNKQVIQIRESYLTGRYSYMDLSREFNISAKQVGNIVNQVHHKGV